MNKKIIEAINLSKTFLDGENKIMVLENINFEAFSGETIAIIGASGSGKSTFLQLIAGLDQQTSGEIYLKDRNILNMTDNEKSEFRNKHIGFVFQFHHLLEDFTALENVMFPLLIQRDNEKEIKNKAIDILKVVGLENRLNHYPSKLSGGEKQRVSIARALISNPSIIFADEPTGNLDEDTSIEIMDLFISVVKEKNSSLIMVTHNKDLAKKCSKIYLMKNHKLMMVNEN